VAHSNGGALAIYGLAHKQLQADKLVLIGAAGIRDRQKTKRLLIKIIAKTGKTATFWLPVEKRQKLRKRLYGVVGSDMLLVPHMQETFKQTVRQDVQEEASQLKLPTLLIYGQNDRATPPLYGEIYQQLIKGAKLQIVPDAGHFVHHDQPAQSMELIREFLI
jgi:pimeloyl-ACP methyl ester carboxylesterase